MPSEPLPTAWGGPPARALVRSAAEDFQVDEELGFAPDGQGQHLLLRIRKRDINSEWLARRLARVAGVAPRSVGFAGLKDRRAVTTQWFSIDLAGEAEPDWSELESERIRILQVARHRRKLRRGSLAGNRFSLVLRQVEGDRGALEQRLHRIAAEGVPNYFGPQRFGRGGENLQRAAALFRGELRGAGRHRRGLYLSAARSLLFNRVLAVRVEQGSWREALEGEALLLAGTRSFFVAERLDEAIRRRVAAGDLLPSAPLWGEGDSPARGSAAALEREALEGYQEWCRGLKLAGLRQERRALCLRPERLAWEWLEEGSLRLDFFLPAGGYATVLIRELVEPGLESSAGW